MLIFADTDPVAVASLITTVVLAILTGVYVVTTHRLVQAQTEPCVIVYACHDESRPSLLLVMIENVGNGIARNVRFTLSEPYFVAYGFTEPFPEPEPRPTGPFVDGIPLLPPGGTRKMIWGQFFGLMNALDGRKITVKCSYDRVTNPLEESPTRTQDCVLDIESFGYHDAVDPDGARQCAKQLKNCVDELKKICKRFDG